MRSVFSPIKLEEVDKIREKNGQKKMPELAPPVVHGLTADIERLIYLASRGLDRNEIAAAMGKTGRWVDESFRKDIVKSRVGKYTNKILKSLVKRRISNIADKAVDKLENLIDNDGTKDAVRLNAINSVLDRTLGRAEQKVSHEGNLIKKLYEEIKDERIKKETTRTIDVANADIQEAEIVESKEASQIDVWLNKNSKD